MNRLTRLIRELREELERVDRRAPGGNEGPDLTVLEDAELERLNQLVRRTQGRPPPVTREQFLARVPNPETWKRHSSRNRCADPPLRAEEAATGTLTVAKRVEAEALLVKIGNRLEG